MMYNTFDIYDAKIEMQKIRTAALLEDLKAKELKEKERVEAKRLAKEKDLEPIISRLDKIIALLENMR